MLKSPRDRFDDVPRATGRVGAHRAEQPGMSGLVVLLWSAAAALVLIVIGIFLSLLMMGRISLFPAADGTGGQAAGVTAKIDTSYRVLVLNATPDGELTAEVRKALLSEGWSDDAVIGTDGATASFDTTTVFFVENADESAALGLAKLLDGAEVEQSDAYAGLDDSSQPQLTVVIGTDRTSGAAEEPDAPAQ